MVGLDVNASAIIPGVEYAYTQYPRKNLIYHASARRIRVLHVYKLEDPYRFKRRTLVECQLLTDDGELETDSYSGQVAPVITVTARQVVATWDEHLVEKERYDVEQRKRSEQRREESERRRKVQEERQRQADALFQAKKSKEDALIEHISEKLDVPKRAIFLTTTYVNISRSFLKEVNNEHEQDTRQESDSESIERRTSSNF